MSFTKYAFAAAAAFAGIASADDGCTFSKAVTITAAGDASSLGACSTISGDISFATGMAQPTLALPSVEEIDGDWTYTQDATVQSISAPMLKKISGSFKLDNLTSLNNIQFQSLQTSGDVYITNCASLSTVNTGPQYSEAGTIRLGNTYLGELGGFGNLTKVDALDISGNPLLSDITMNINSVKSISIGSNEEANMGLSVRFDNLTIVLDGIVVQNATNVSFAKLQTVTNNIQMISNNFETFSAPNLTNAGGLVLNSNPKLTKIDLPSLKQLNGSQGTFEIANNTNLQDISGFPQLTNFAHDVAFIGTFNNASVSSFKMIAGSLQIRSTADITDLCNDVKSLKSSQVVRGTANCTSGDPTANGTTSTKGGSSGGSSTSSPAMPLSIPALPVLSAGLGAALLQFLLSF